MTDKNNAALDLCTSSGGRAYIADYFATQLRRHDFAKYINSTLAADFACALAQHLPKLRAEGVQADEPVADAVVRQCPRCTGNGTILRLSGNGPDAYDVQEECSHCEGSGVASAPVAGEALFWYRPRSDGSYEGPIHNDHIEDVRRRSGAWLPLLPTPQFSAAQDTPTDADLNACFPASLGPGGEWALKGARIALARYGHTAPKATKAERIVFPAHLLKMWSGGEVQAWLDNHQGITPPKASATGSLERYRNWRAEQAEADKDGVSSEGRQ